MIPRKIQIQPVLNGYICQVGCQTVVFGSTEELMTALEDYLKDPGKIEAWYREKALHNEMLKECVPTQGPTPVNPVAWMQEPVQSHTRDPIHPLSQEQIAGIPLSQEPTTCPEPMPPQALAQTAPSITRGPTLR